MRFLRTFFRTVTTNGCYNGYGTRFCGGFSGNNCYFFFGATGFTRFCFDAFTTTAPTAAVTFVVATFFGDADEVGTAVAVVADAVAVCAGEYGCAFDADVGCAVVAGVVE